MPTSGDQTLVVYYTEQRLGFNDQDIVYLVIIIGLLGIIVQEFLLNRLIYWLCTMWVNLSGAYNQVIHNRTSNQLITAK